MTKEEFKRLRKSAGLSQMATAALLGVNFTTVNRWEAGRFNVNRHAARIFAQEVSEKLNK